MDDVKRTAKQVCIAVTLSMVGLFGSPPEPAAASKDEYTSKYAGQEKRQIKSLSTEDIKELRAGAGWGLAKAAELNGLPGPKHVLEMKKEIELTAEQESMMVAVFKDMQKRAIELGNKLIEYERDLNSRFAERNIDNRTLEELLSKIAETYKSLRYTHLAAHLLTPGILSEDQIKKYNNLRGYSAEDPCAKVPAGHDPAMWRKHNNCD